MVREIHARLMAQAREALRYRDGKMINGAGRTLRDWLVRTFEASTPPRSEQGTLFTQKIAVDDDVPLLLEAFARVTERMPDDLVEAWALEESTPGTVAVEPAPSLGPISITEEVSGRIAELLDLAETLFEETVSDAHRGLGVYPEGQQAEESAAEIFRSLRKLLGLSTE